MFIIVAVSLWKYVLIWIYYVDIDLFSQLILILNSIFCVVQYSTIMSEITRSFQ